MEYVKTAKLLLSGRYTKTTVRARNIQAIQTKVQIEVKFILLLKLV